MRILIFVKAWRGDPAVMVNGRGGEMARVTDRPASAADVVTRPGEERRAPQIIRGRALFAAGAMMGYALAIRPEGEDHR